MWSLTRGLFAVAAVAIALGGCTRDGGQTGHEDSPRDGGDRSLFDELGQGSADRYVPVASLSELFDLSQAVIVGRAERVERGRSFVDDESGVTIEQETVVLHVSVLEALKGGAREALYVEFYVRSAEDSLPAALPDERLLLFVDWASLAPRSASESIEGAGRGLPEGADLHRLTTPQGFASETENGGAMPVLEPNDGVLAEDSFSALLERIRELARESPSAADGGADGGGAPIGTPTTDAASPTTTDGGTTSVPGPLDASMAPLVFTDPTFFSLPINSVRYGVSGYDAASDLCVSVIWYFNTIEESRFCEDTFEPMGLRPYVTLEAGMPAGCWGYGGNVELLAQRGCVDFGEITTDTDDSVDLEVDVRSDLFTGTVRFVGP